jgi:hypothetical protein
MKTFLTHANPDARPHRVTLQVKVVQFVVLLSVLAAMWLMGDPQ